MSAARDIMHAGATCVLESETLETAARRMRELDSMRCRSAAPTTGCTVSSPTATLW